MSPIKTEKTNSQIPSLQVFQFDSEGSGKDYVNLFRGALNLPIKLATLPSRNGMCAEISLNYSNETSTEIETWNAENPTGILGVGWKMGFGRIIRSGAFGYVDSQADFFIEMDGETSQLIEIQVDDTVGKVPHYLIADLQKKSCSPKLKKYLSSIGVQLTPKHKIVLLQESLWMIKDDELELEYLVKKTADGAKISKGGVSYEMSNYKFWQIRYFETYDKWYIVKEDGSRYSFGGKGARIDNDDPNVLQKGIKWGSWTGSSVNSQNQENYTTAWNLARVENLVGNYIQYSYLVTEQSVGKGNLTYTKACYLDSITNDLGWSCKYHYKQKTYDNSSLDAPKEYLDPFLDPSELPTTNPNAYQSKYETLYLSSIDVRNADQETQLSLSFDYHDLQNLTIKDGKNLLGYGATHKRFLKSITESYPNTDYSSSIRFDYIFSVDESRNKGALQSITYPSGGSTTFSYKKIYVGGNDKSEIGARNLTISNPFGDIVGTPRFWYGQDYVVIGWYDSSQNKIKLNVYTWIGRWCKSVSEWFDFNVVLDVDKWSVSTSENSFLLALPCLDESKTEVYLFNRKHLEKANWEIHKTDGAADKITFKTNKIEVNNGNDFHLIQDIENKILTRFSWNCLKRDWEKNTISNKDGLCQSGTGNSFKYYMTAHLNYYVIFCYDQINEIGKFNLFYRDKLLEWNNPSTLLSKDISIPSFNGFSYFSFSPGESFVGMSFITNYTSEGSSFKAFDYDMRLISWDSEYKNLNFNTLDEKDISNFKNIPRSLLNQLGPQLIDNSVIGSGPNVFLYDGSTWQHQFLGIKYKIFSDPSIQYYWYSYDNKALICTENTESGIYSTINTRQLNNPSAGWKTTVLRDIDQPKQGRQIMDYPTLVQSYATLGGDIYNRSVYPNWGNIKDFLVHSIDETNLDSTTMIAQPPNFLSYMTVDNEGNPKGTNILFFKNGNLIKDAEGNPIVEAFNGQQMFKLLDRQYHYKASVSGQLPSITNGFVTFPIDSKNGFNCKEITLHRYSNHSVQDKIETFVVNQVISDSGYDKRYDCYEYDDISASSDHTATVIRFQKVTKYLGCQLPLDQKNGYETTMFYNGLPVLETSDNNADHYTCLDGMIVSKEIFDKNGKRLKSSQNQWSVSTTVSTDASEKNQRNIYGGIPRIVSITIQNEGIETKKEMDYSSFCGKVIRTSESYYGSQGELITSQLDIKYAYQVYAAMCNQHILTPFSQKSTSVKVNENDFKIQNLKCITSKNWKIKSGKEYWAEFESYIPAVEKFTPFTWWEEGKPDDTWSRLSTVDLRNEYGNKVVSRDVVNTLENEIYDDQNRFVHAQFTTGNGSLVESSSFDSFETYQKSTWEGGEIDKTDSFTGKQCLTFLSNQRITKTISVSKTTSKVVFGGWFKHPKSSTKKLNFSIKNVATEKNISKQFEINKDWQNIQWHANITELLEKDSDTTDLECIIDSKFFQETGLISTTYVDNLYFMPSLVKFSASIVDEDQLCQTAMISLNSAVKRTFRNSHKRPNAHVGVLDNVIGFDMHYVVSQMGAISPTDFPKTSPNFSVSVQGSSKGVYDDFKLDSLAKYDPIHCSISDWKVDSVNRLLSFSGKSTEKVAELQRNSFTTENSMGIYVKVVGENKNCIQVGEGMYYVRWNIDKWQFISITDKSEDVIAEDNKIPFQNEWMFIVFESRILFYANGILIFNFSSSTVALHPHQICLGMQNTGTSFKELMVAETLSLSLQFHDGLGRSIQQTKVESSETVIVNKHLCDELGRKAISVKSSRISVDDVKDPFSYLNDYITNGNVGGSIWSDQPIEGDILKFHPKDKGYPFTRVIFEPSPLSRPFQQGGEGIDYAITGNNPHTSTTTYGLNSDEGPFLFKLPKGNYLVKTETDANGVQTIIYFDSKGRTIGTIVKNGLGQDKDFITSKVYDEFGNGIASIPPSYYVSKIK